MAPKPLSLAFMLTSLLLAVTSSAHAAPVTRQRSRSPRNVGSRTNKHKRSRNSSGAAAGGPAPANRTPVPNRHINRPNPTIPSPPIPNPIHNNPIHQIPTSDLPLPTSPAGVRRHHDLPGTGAPLGSAGAGPSRLPIPDIPQNDIRVNIPETFPPYVPPEFLPEADWVRPFYRQCELTIPCHLPRFSYGWKYGNLHDYVNMSDAQVFGLYLTENQTAIDEILNSDHYSPMDKRPVNCPSGCVVQTYPYCLISVMRELHTKHDNLVNTITAYVPRTRNEVYTPTQLAQFIGEHTLDKLSEYQMSHFLHDVLAQCFTVDLSELDHGDYAYALLAELESHEFPRLDMNSLEILFPNLRCRHARHVNETIAAFVSHAPLAAMYDRACRNLDNLRHPENRNLISIVPRLTIKGRDDANDETGVQDRSVRFACDTPPVHPRVRPSSLHARAVHVPAIPSRTLHTPKLTPVSCVKAVYSVDDELVDTDPTELLCPILSPAQARAYLNERIPIRTHMIWSSLLNWNKDNIHLMKSSTPDFHSWWQRFQLQASQHKLPPAVAWRLATWLLPDIYQINILQYIQEPDFTGFNIHSWVQFVSRAAGGKDSAILAMDELHSLSPRPSESLSSFLLRFQSIAQRASSCTSVLETGLSPKCYLEGRTDTELFTDHQPLVWICSQPTLSRKQTRWVLFLQRFQFTLKYVPGKHNPADVLSRAPHLEFPAAFHDTQFMSHDPVLAAISASITNKSKRLRSATKKHVNMDFANELPPPPPCTVPSSVTFDDIARLRQLARSGFQSMPAPDTGLLLGNNTLIDADADPPIVSPLPSLGDQSRDLNAKHISFSHFLSLVVEGYASDPTFHEHTHKLQQVGQYWF